MGTPPATAPRKKNRRGTSALVVKRKLMNRENTTIPIPAPSTNRTRKDMLFPGLRKKELTEEMSLSYTPMIMAMEPPLTPGTVMVPPIHIPFNIVIR